jgi:hypothetical protein
MYGARRALANWLDRHENAEYHPHRTGSGTLQNWLALEAHEGMALLIDDPRLAPPKDALLELRRQVEPRTQRDFELEQEAAGVRSLQTCGWTASFECDEHGPRFKSRKTCCLPDHSFCPTQVTKKLRVLTLPAPPEGGCYRAVWLGKAFDLPVETAAEGVQGVLRAATEAARVVRRRIMGKGLMSKAISFRMAHGRSVAHIKLVFLEKVKGDSDEAVAEFAKVLGAIVLGNKRTSAPGTIVVQLMADSTYHLFALESPDPELYAAWYFGTNGSRLFESYGFLREMLKEWPAKGEVTIPAGASSVVVDHRLGIQALAEAKPAGYVNRPWVEQGVVSADGKVRDWHIDIGEQVMIKLDSPSPADCTFLWHAREDPTPVCDICGMKLVMVLSPPDGPEDGGA